jgi:3-methyladenine DNA glycosylase AlkD
MKDEKMQGHSPLTASVVKVRLQQLGDPVQAEFLQGFFKTGAGQYGEGDVFIGVRVPQVRALLRESRTIPVEELLLLLQSPAHEERLFALLGLVREFEKGDDVCKTRIFELYLGNSIHINNWDLVDCSAPRIVGSCLLERDREVLYRLAASASLWERRIAILATFTFIRHNQFDDTLTIAGLLLKDREDLIHKATGWMLRELGKRDMTAVEAFLKVHVRQMPRTMLRYAIERFPEQTRRLYLHMK